MSISDHQRALVTGAYGFLGRHTARRLKQLGWRVIGLGHRPKDRWWPGDDWREWGLSEWHEGDITLAGLQEHAGEPEAVFHCAGGGSVGYSLTNPVEDFRKGVDGTLQVLEFIRLHAPRARLVYPSSAAVYGNARAQPIVEEAEQKPLSPYGEHKKLAEDLIRFYGRRFGVRAGIIRYFSVYGPELRKQLLWDTCGRGAGGADSRATPFHGTGDETRDWLHVTDAVSLSLAVMEQASQECPVFNGGSGLSASVRQTVEAVFSQLCPGVGVQFNHQARGFDPEHYLADISKARTLGWVPKIGWRAGVTEYVRWYQGALDR
jgi:UDP-glucose 4-epimerase